MAIRGAEVVIETSLAIGYVTRQRIEVGAAVPEG